MNTISVIRTQNLQNNSHPMQISTKKANCYYTGKMTDKCTQKNVTFSGNFINGIKNLLNERRVRRSFKAVCTNASSIKEFKSALAPMNNSQSILDIIHTPANYGIDGPVTEFGYIINSSEKLKALGEKLKTLGVDDPLLEMLQYRYFAGTFGLDCPALTQIMNFFSTELPELCSKNCVTKYFKPMVDDIIDMNVGINVDSPERLEKLRIALKEFTAVAEKNN